MRYRYFYQTKENKSLDGWIEARDRNDAYARLRKQGIKPYRLVGRNPSAWRRGALTAVLSAALAVSVAAYLLDYPASRREGFADGYVRHQIYGDPAIIGNGIATRWSACGLDDGERHLARYAQPGLQVENSPIQSQEPLAEAVEASLSRRLESQDGEMLEYRQLKQIVESMKSELRRYLAAGGTTKKYLVRLHERQCQEVACYRAAAQELEEARSRLDDDALAALWAAKNAELRAVGLPMLREPAEE